MNSNYRFWNHSPLEFTLAGKRSRSKKRTHGFWNVYDFEDAKSEYHILIAWARGNVGHWPCSGDPRRPYLKKISIWRRKRLTKL
jgi:hypothetical protein